MKGERPDRTAEHKKKTMKTNLKNQKSELQSRPEQPRTGLLHGNADGTRSEPAKWFPDALASADASTNLLALSCRAMKARWRASRFVAEFEGSSGGDAGEEFSGRSRVNCTCAPLRRSG